MILFNVMLRYLLFAVRILFGYYSIVAIVKQMLVPVILFRKFLVMHTNDIQSDEPAKTVIKEFIFSLNIR